MCAFVQSSLFKFTRRCANTEIIANLPYHNVHIFNCFLSVKQVVCFQADMKVIFGYSSIVLDE